MEKVHNAVHLQRPNKKNSWWLSGKRLRLKSLLPLWSQVRTLWLLIYMMTTGDLHGR